MSYFLHFCLIHYRPTSYPNSHPSSLILHPWKIYVSLSRAKLAGGESLTFGMQKTVFCDPKHISFAKNPSSFIPHLSSLFPKHICFTRKKRKKIPTEFVKIFRRIFCFFNICEARALLPKFKEKTPLRKNSSFYILHSSFLIVTLQAKRKSSIIIIELWHF